MSATRSTRVDKVLLTIALCATTGAWCAANARTIDLWEWSKNGVASLARLATSASGTPVRIEFGPEDGRRAAVTYRRRYGYRGEWLIEQLGNGLGPGPTLSYDRPVPDTFLAPPPSTIAKREVGITPR